MSKDLDACTLGVRHKKTKADMSQADLAVAGKLQPKNSAFSVQRPLSPGKPRKKSAFSL